MDVRVCDQDYFPFCLYNCIIIEDSILFIGSVKAVTLIFNF